MPRHAFHAAHSASVTASSARTLRWISCITRSFLTCTFLSSSSSSFLSAAFKSQRTEVLSMPSPPASNGTERRGTPASGHRGAADNPCGSATSAKGAGRVPELAVFYPRCVRHEYEYCDVCVNRSDDNMLDVCFQESQLTSDPTTSPQQCNKGDRQRCQSS